LLATWQAFHVPRVFTLHWEGAAAIHAAFDQEGKLSAAIELRRRLPRIAAGKTFSAWTMTGAVVCPDAARPWRLGDSAAGSGVAHRHGMRQTAGTQRCRIEQAGIMPAGGQDSLGSAPFMRAFVPYRLPTPRHDQFPGENQ